MPTPPSAAQGAAGPFPVRAARARAATTSQIDILYCGVCHSDLHQARNEWGNTVYPVVPGHEIVGRVAAVGARGQEASRSATWPASAAWSTPAGTARTATTGWSSTAAKARPGPTTARDRHPARPTYGGYSDQIVVDEDFVAAGSRAQARSRRRGAAAVRRHHHLFAAAALEGRAGPEGRRRRPGRPRPHGRQARQGDGRARGAVHDLARARPRTPAPGRARGAWSRKTPTRWRSTPAASTSSSTPSPRQHDLNAYLDLLKRDGTMVLVGAPTAARSDARRAFKLIFAPQRLAGSLIGGMRETQEMLDFCAEHGIISRHRDDPASRRSTRPMSAC